MTETLRALARRHGWMALTVFLVSGLVLGGFAWRAEMQRIDAHRAEARLLAGDVAQALENRMERLMSATYLMAAFVRANGGEVTQFEQLATEMLPFYPGVTSLGLAPGGIVRYAIPLEPNRATIGFNQLADPVQSPEAFLARDTGRLTLAGPLNLVQGGLGAVGRLPVFLPHPQRQEPQFWGFAFVTIRFPDAFEGLGLESLTERGYRYELWRRHPDTGQRQVIAASEDVISGQPLKQGVGRSVKVPNGEWLLDVEPRAGWAQIGPLLIQGAFSMAFSAMLALLVWLLLARTTQKVALEHQVAQRTREIEEARQELQATLNAVPDVLFDLDADGMLHAVHTHHRTQTLYAPQHIQGRNIADFLPLDALQTIRASMADAARDGRSSGRQYPIDTPQGRQWFELSMAAKAAPAADGTSATPARFIALARNITARKQAELQYHLAAQFFAGSSEGFVITDAEQRIIQINPAFTAITGYPEEAVIGQKPSILSSGRHDRTFYEAMWRSIRQTGHWEGEIWNRRRNGEEYPEWLSISRIQDGSGQTTHYVAIFSDISRRLEQEARIRDLAYYDNLTGLANRTLLRDRVQHDLSMARRHDQPLSLLFIDLDHFKHVNDSLGHQVGDQLLVEVARRIRSLVREQDTVARLGGDEFVAVLPETGAEGAAHAATVLLKTLGQPYDLGTQELTVTPSIGIALYPNDGSDFETLYRCADTAMYRAKQEGRNRHAFFTQEMQALAMRRLQLENALRRAIERGEMCLHYQPQISLCNGSLIGVEALLRWNHPTLGAISPAEFIPVAEHTGQIVTIGEWVLRQACVQLQQWRQAGLPSMVVAVNLSAAQFRQPDLVQRVAQALADSGLPAEWLELELTESTAMHDPQAAIATVDALRALGVHLSLDDFGTGYSSLNHLKRFQIGKLKIDQSFVRGLPDDAEDAGIVETIIQMARSLGLKTVAEGVETEAQRAFLQQRGCDQMQGYLLARPLPAKDFESWWRARFSPEG
jgi:diguanylate cyclase (GGDEF)-like protein/PAS domain S-box-containing protein